MINLKLRKYSRETRNHFNDPYAHGFFVTTRGPMITVFRMKHMRLY